MLFGMRFSSKVMFQPDPAFGFIATIAYGSRKYRHSPGLMVVFDGMFEPVGDSAPVETFTPFSLKVGVRNGVNWVVPPAPS